MELQSYFHETIESSSIFTLANNLEDLLNYIASANKKQQIFKEFFHQISISAFFMKPERYLGYQIYNSKDSVLLFLLNNWIFASSPKENSLIIESIIQKIRLEYFESKNTSYLNSGICNILRLTEEKLEYSGEVLRDNKIKILNLDCTHHEWNCYYSATLQPEKKLLDDCIIVTQLLAGRISSCEFGFLHELGHLLHTRLTIQLSMVPPSFNDIIEAILPNRISEDEKNEMFADYFASAVLWDTSYAHCDHLELSDVIKGAFSLYFRSLIKETFQ